MLDHSLRIQLVDRGAEHQLHEAIDMSTGSIKREWHCAAVLEPALEHDIMFAFIRAMPLDGGDELMIIGGAEAHGLEYAIEGGIAAMLVVNVDRSEQVDVPDAKPLKHKPKTTKKLCRRIA